VSGAPVRRPPGAGRVRDVRAREVRMSAPQVAELPGVARQILTGVLPGQAELLEGLRM
jgi:hypothetical protein